MATRATQETIVERVSIGNLFSPVPDTDFRDFLEEVEELARFAPEIIKNFCKVGTKAQPARLPACPRRLGSARE